MNGKIAHLPKPIREQLNRRLDNAERHDRVLTWLNSLPEVQAQVASEFDGVPVSKQNLYQYSQHGFRLWKNRQNALAFAAEDLAASEASDTCSTSSLTDKLIQWVALRFAASAHTLTPADDEPESDLRHLRHIAADIIALRRGDLYSRRVAVEEQRLALQAARDEQTLEHKFWEWTQRPDIREQLEDEFEEEFEKRRAWHDTLRAAVPEIAPFLCTKKTKSLPDEADTPAALI
jgi:hypothetical protein